MTEKRCLHLCISIAVVLLIFVQDLRVIVILKQAGEGLSDVPEVYCSSPREFVAFPEPVATLDIECFDMPLRLYN